MYIYTHIHTGKSKPAVDNCNTVELRRDDCTATMDIGGGRQNETLTQPSVVLIRTTSWKRFDILVYYMYILYVRSNHITASNMTMWIHYHLLETIHIHASVCEQSYSDTEVEMYVCIYIYIYIYITSVYIYIYIYSCVYVYACLYNFYTCLSPAQDAGLKLLFKRAAKRRSGASKPINMTKHCRRALFASYYFAIINISISSPQQKAKYNDI